MRDYWKNELYPGLGGMGEVKRSDGGEERGRMMVLGSVPSTALIWRDLTNIFVYVFSANYTLPEESKKADPEKEGDKDEISPFKEIIFTELQREEAATIVAEYNKVCI